VKILFLFLSLACQAADVKFAWDPPLPSTNIAFYDFNLYRTGSWHFAQTAALSPATEGVLRGLSSGTYIVGLTAISSNGLTSDISNSVTAMVRQVVMNLEYTTNLGVSNGWQVSSRVTNALIQVTNQLFYRTRLQLQ